MIYHFLGESSKQISEEAMQLLIDYAWPGNVRELENTIKAIATAPQDVIHFLELPDIIREQNKEVSLQLGQAMESYEKSYILRALRQTNGSISKAATLLGVPYNTLWFKIDKLNIPH